MSDQTPKAWYAEAKRFDGAYAPVIFYDDHPTKSSTGKTRDVRNVQPLDFAGWDQLTLNELHARFNGEQPPKIEDATAISEQ